MIHDEMALDLMLKGDTAGLRRLAKVADGEIDCPDCGAAGPHDENGSDTLCCVNCGTHFEVAACRHESEFTADGNGASCRFCGETLA